MDLSQRMVEAARAAHPHLRFEQAELTTLPVQDGALAGIVYWYSIIATPLERLAAAWQELDRTLAPSGLALVAFQAGGGEAVTMPDAHGSSHALTLYRHDVEHVTATLRDAGFDVSAQVVRRPQLAHETTPQAFLLCERHEAALT